jgi:hypothetical protein
MVIIILLPEVNVDVQLEWLFSALVFRTIKSQERRLIVTAILDRNSSRSECFTS